MTGSVEKKGGKFRAHVQVRVEKKNKNVRGPCRALREEAAET